MAEKQFDVIVVGGGIFGVTTAIELVQRRHGRVALFEPGPIPHENAASTDISKVIRGDYGTDELYSEMMEICLPRWKQWNKDFGVELFHQTGILIMSKQWTEGSYEKSSFDTLNRRGTVKLEHLSATALTKRFPAWRGMQGYFNPAAGWAESGNVVTKLFEKATRLGVQVFQIGVLQVNSKPHRTVANQKIVTGITTVEGVAYSAPKVIVAAGANTPYLLPQLRPYMWASAQTVFHFENSPANPIYDPKHFPVYASDTPVTGMYGFPPHPKDNRLKIGCHGAGLKLLNVTNQELEKLWRQHGANEEKKVRSYLKTHMPELANAKVLFHRLCCYCDTFDGNFWIDMDPETEGLLAAAGGSGHGFKFGPMLGELIVDKLEGKTNKFLERFKWRKPIPGVFVKEEMRYLGNESSATPKASL